MKKNKDWKETTRNKARRVTNEIHLELAYKNRCVLKITLLYVTSGFFKNTRSVCLKEDEFIAHVSSFMVC